MGGWLLYFLFKIIRQAGRQAGRDEIKNISRLLVYSLASIHIQNKLTFIIPNDE